MKSLLFFILIALITNSAFASETDKTPLKKEKLPPKYSDDFYAPIITPNGNYRIIKRAIINHYTSPEDVIDSILIPYSPKCDATAQLSDKKLCESDHNIASRNNVSISTHLSYKECNITFHVPNTLKPQELEFIKLANQNNLATIGYLEKCKVDIKKQ